MQVLFRYTCRISALRSFNFIPKSALKQAALKGVASGSYMLTDDLCSIIQLPPVHVSHALHLQLSILKGPSQTGRLIMQPL